VFKRYMPLLFVVLVVLATALVFLVFRDTDAPGAPPPAAVPPARAPAPVTGPDGVPEFHVETEEEYQLALEAMGTSSDDIEAWARSRGFPPATYTNSPGTPLERNYRGAREPELRQLAEEGDRWAMQFLAALIAPEKPLEAIDWYRKAVVHGSAYAAFKLGTFYHDVARWLAINQDDREEVKEIARREDPLAYSSLGWLLVAEYEAGLPPGAIAASLASFREPDEGITRSCERAATFLAEIRAEREALGISVSPRQPPLAIELPAEETAGYCSPEVFPRADFSGCETIRLVGDAGALTGHRCR
jgi:hypothetical protein